MEIILNTPMSPEMFGYFLGRQHPAGNKSNSFIYRGRGTVFACPGTESVQRANNSYARPALASSKLKLLLTHC
jgi:hypothetical protein